MKIQFVKEQMIFGTKSEYSYLCPPYREVEQR